MQGWRTVAFGVAVAVAPTLLTYLGGVDWVTLGVHPALAGLIGTAIIGLRAMTATPIGKSSR